MNTSEFPSLHEENHLKVLRLLQVNPQLSQRDLADALGISLGKTNYCLKALVGKGFIKMQSFQKSPNKLAYAYLLTPVGIAEKAGLTMRFLTRKVAEFESLTLEIEALKFEVNQAPVNSAEMQDRSGAVDDQRQKRDA
jgi:EPS-associated MarR family transcriptional regulator